MGRKRIPIESCIERIEQAVLLGATYELAAAYAGVSAATFWRWKAKMQAAPGGSSLAQLRDRLRAAEGRAAVGWLAKIEKAASEGNWQAASWKLERRYPEIYGRTFQKVAFTDVTGENSAEAMVIYLPSKAPSAEVWAEDVKQLMPPAAAHGSEPE